MEDEYYYLQHCLVLAKQAAEKGNSRVGAVVVKDQKIISEAEEAVKTKNDISCHAEMEALRQAVKICIQMIYQVVFYILRMSLALCVLMLSGFIKLKR